jgi:ATP-binding cassette subfamily B (MDR/TAP) protein 9
MALAVSVLYYGGHLVINGIITGGTFVSFILYQMELGNCIEVILGEFATCV